MGERYLYIVAGPNGAGKTTASFTLLPEILDCKEFVNADEIARGLSPFQPENVSVQAGRLMLARIGELMEAGVNFAFETTLATKSYKGIISKAKSLGYKIILIFFWLESDELAKQRVLIRVSEGGHNIPNEIITRRYNRGVANLNNIYFDICDEVYVFDNSVSPGAPVMEKVNGSINIFNQIIFNKINSMK